MYRARGEYIWIDGFGDLRSKTRIITLGEDSGVYPEFGIWNYDGSSTGQAVTESSEVHIKPVYVVPDPFRSPVPVESGASSMLSYLVLCETFLDSECTKPHPTNTRAKCRQVMDQYADHQPMFGMEQEFFMVDLETGMPLDWQGEEVGVRADLKETARNRFYCGIGAGRVSVRTLLDDIVEKALQIGLNITGANYEVAPGQAEIQICEKNIKGADGLWLVRYLLMRGMEDSGIRVDFRPKPIKGDWNGSGCHTNFSTKAMRAPGGYEAAIIPAMERLKAKHKEHIQCYGAGNWERLTGTHETSSMEEFTWGVANRGASVRIPTVVALEGCGYFEDRRPSSSMDPYLVTARIVETVCSPESGPESKTSA